jgi:hypothetical protein
MARAKDIQKLAIKQKRQKAIGTIPRTKAEMTKGLATRTGPRSGPQRAALKTGQMKGAARGARPASRKGVGKSTSAKKGTTSNRWKTT